MKSRRQHAEYLAAWFFMYVIVLGLVVFMTAYFITVDRDFISMDLIQKIELGSTTMRSSDPVVVNPDAINKYGWLIVIEAIIFGLAPLLWAQFYNHNEKEQPKEPPEEHHLEWSSQTIEVRSRE